MKKAIFIYLALVLIFLSDAKIYAQEDELEPSGGSDQTYAIQSEKINYENTPLNKLGRGLINTTTFWVEIPAQVCVVSKEKDPATGLTLGAAEGLVTGLLRGTVGLFDTLTCVIPPYNKPLMNPEYGYNSADAKMRETLW